jgi:hypothetical protein
MREKRDVVGDRGSSWATREVCRGTDRAVLESRERGIFSLIRNSRGHHRDARDSTFKVYATLSPLGSKSTERRDLAGDGARACIVSVSVGAT